MVLKFSARVDTYFLYNETLIDYATELNITLILEVNSIILFKVTSTESKHLIQVVYYQHEQLERF